ncbi:hypothetical protein [Burkholderia phage Bp-AMP4]|uniref:Uncharacterized protein n=1 Tax=Burkholderia phage Bp-AMP4 TaxID=1437329 RepID=A0A0A8KXK1_9CAUD|nr:hypothetical protein [Burkholderia phage Bp-AMP4]
MASLPMNSSDASKMVRRQPPTSARPSSSTIDLPAPYVCVGARTCGGSSTASCKDNHITASIEDNEGLSDLRKKLEEKMAKRGAKVVPLTRRAVPDETDINDVLDSIERSAM